MLFKFLKYVQPTHYFSLKRNDGTSIFPIASELPEVVLQQLQEDNNYSSKMATAYDLSFQAVLKGYTGDAPTYRAVERLPVKDEYRFLRKNFHPIWVLYVLLLRVCSFHNPFTELGGFLRTRKVRRVPYTATPLKNDSWENFNASLTAQNPLVTVVIPTLNRYKYLAQVLRDFEVQSYTNFEIVVVDQSQPFNPDFYAPFKLHINVVRQEEPALWLARNTAIEQAKGEIIALSEDDVRIPKYWIETHLKCLDYFQADISAGVFFPEGEKIPQNRSFFSIASQFATGNAMLYKDVFRKVKLFDRQFEKQRMGDGEFGLRCYLQSLKSISNPLAYCEDIKAEVGGLRQMGSWDAFRTKKLFAPRPIPSVLYLYRRYYGNRSAVLALLKSVPPSIIPYRFKRNKMLLLLGIFVSVFLLPLISIQVFISWRKATKKIVEGPLIRSLD
ncbi:glycosyltransferase family 2 protein [Rasiella rasia]|uniref:Glycosyltransferase family 2 protein n=1 Tax=Rasiella rasia TaxID=2744027 RepID=A0A6G6GPV8_9FLAO|nr:glycosyltransferase family A protein [Rasiella rasia]QIE60635.1 glycosyltransferase family 2 protein [Rasiella rasia]